VVKWGILSCGRVYSVGTWQNGHWHDGSFWRALRECWLLRRSGDRTAWVVRR